MQYLDINFVWELRGKEFKAHCLVFLSAYLSIAVTRLVADGDLHFRFTYLRALDY